MKRTDKIKSYFFPVSVEVTGSKWNPVLEIILYSGKYSLNSLNANYSFGSLHTLFRKIFRSVNLEWKDINNVLILGFGTGSIASIINSYKKDCMIDGVEIDEKVLELGRKYFQTDKLNNVNIYNEGAARYVKHCNKEYDLILIDVYRDIIVPAEVETEDFLYDIRNSLKSGGIVIFNKLIYSKTTSQVDVLKNLYEKVFTDVKVLTIMVTSRVFVAIK